MRQFCIKMSKREKKLTYLVVILNVSNKRLKIYFVACRCNFLKSVKQLLNNEDNNSHDPMLLLCLVLFCRETSSVSSNLLHV